MNSKTAQTWAVILTGLGSLMAALDTLVVATALPTIRLDLGRVLRGGSRGGVRRDADEFGRRHLRRAGEAGRQEREQPHTCQDPSHLDMLRLRFSQ